MRWQQPMGGSPQPSPTLEQCTAVLRALDDSLHFYPGKEGLVGTVALNIIRRVWGEEEAEAAKPQVIDIIREHVERDVVIIERTLDTPIPETFLIQGLEDDLTPN